MADKQFKMETKIRFISAIIIAPAVVFCFLSYNSLVGLVSSIVLISSGELTFSTIKKHRTGLELIYPALATVYPLLYGLAFQNGARELLPVIFISGVLFTLKLVKDRESITEFYFIWFVSIVYISYFLTFFVDIYRKYGAPTSLLILTLSWAYDSFAYFFGMLFGKHKLKSYYSPNKSWEGLIFGILSTIIYVFIYKYVAGIFGKIVVIDSPVLYILTGIITGVFDNFGDIFESSIKRRYNLKHIGNTLPGHGGFLDRIDGLLFVTPIMYIMMKIFIR